MATKSLADTFTDAARKVGNSGDLIQDLFDRGYAIEETKEAVFSMRTNIRDSLRNLDGAGALNSAQSKELNELYPPRLRGTEEPENGTEG